VVTYKWLIRALKVSANVAKQMLYEFVEKQKTAGVELTIFYLVAGQLPKADEADVPVQEICIVPSSQLDSTKARFHLVTGEHIYGIHKENQKDQNALYASDCIEIGDPCLKVKPGCSIAYKKLSFRCDRTSSTADVSVLLAQSSNLKKPSKTASRSVGDKAVATESENHADSHKDSENCGKVESPESTPNHAKEPPKSTSTSSGKRSTVSKSKTRNDVGNRNLAGMFQNMENRQRLVQETKSKAKDIKVEKIVKQADKQDSIKGSAISKKPELDSKKKTAQKARSNEKSGARSKQNNKPETNVKKRRRIIEFSDSSSSSEEEESEPENPIPVLSESPAEDQPEDEEDPFSPKPQHRSGEGKRSCRKRKLVEESVMDEDGFLVTQKKYEEVSSAEDSCHENEDPIPAAIKPVPAKASKASVVVPKSKQVMLTSFFQKK